MIFTFILAFNPMAGQNISPATTIDTVSIARMQYVDLSTNNGTDCICTIGKLDSATPATISRIGATAYVRISGGLPFNGTHILPPAQQWIAVADFKGKKLIVANYSAGTTRILVSILCSTNR